MKTKIKLPEENSDNELPIRLSSLYIFAQTYERTKSIQMSLVEIINITHGLQVKCILERSKYESADGDFDVPELVHDYLQDTYDVVDEVDSVECLDYIRKTIKSFPQEPLPPDFKVDEAYTITNPVIIANLGAMLMTNAFTQFFEHLVEPLEKMYADEFFQAQTKEGKKQGNARGFEIMFGEKKYRIKSKKSVKKAKANELLQGLLEALDDD